MTKWSVRKIWVATLGIGALTAALVCTYMPVSADTGLSVSGAKLVATASPGDIFTHQITVSIDSSDSPTDITLQVSPMAQYPDGTPRQSQDAGPYSASGFITLDKDSFHLDPGGSQTVTATISIPNDVGDGGRYALITIATRPPAGSALSVITAVNVPLYITIKDSHLTHQGTINNVSANVSNSQGIAVVSVFENTGNHDFKVKNNLTLVDNQGQIVATANTSLSLWTIIPGMSREIKAELVPNVDLSPGLYRVTSQMTLDDGTILATGGTDLNLTTGLSAVAAPASAQPTSPLATQALSNSVPLVPKSGTGNWVFIEVIAGVALLALISYGVFKNRRLKRPATATLPFAVGTENAAETTLPVTPPTSPLLVGHTSNRSIGVLRSESTAVVTIISTRSMTEVKHPVITNGEIGVSIGGKKVPSPECTTDSSIIARPGASDTSRSVSVMAPPVSSDLSPVIAISYSATTVERTTKGGLSDKANPGYVFLLIDMVIKNQGYDSYHIFPHMDFFVVINNVKFSPSIAIWLENQLPSEINIITKGVSIEGRLAFEVPKPINGFTMMYEGSRRYNTQWVSSSVQEKITQLSATRQPAATHVKKMITISYSSTIKKQIGDGYFADTPKPSNVYLVVNMNIDNQSGKSFKMYPRINTYVIIKNIKYRPAPVLNLENRLPGKIDILNEGHIEGKIVFEVPEDAMINSSQMKYEDSVSNNIGWINLGVSIK